MLATDEIGLKVSAAFHFNRAKGTNSYVIRCSSILRTHHRSSSVGVKSGNTEKNLPPVNRNNYPERVEVEENPQMAPILARKGRPFSKIFV